MGSVRGRDSPIRLGRSSYNTATLKPLRVYVHMPQDQASFVRDGDPAAVGSNSIRSVASAETVTRHPFGAGVGDPHYAVEVVIPNDDGALFPRHVCACRDRGLRRTQRA